MRKCRVTKGPWSWLGVDRCVGDILEAKPEQVAAWETDGLVVGITAKEAAKAKEGDAEVVDDKKDKKDEKDENAPKVPKAPKAPKPPKE